MLHRHPFRVKATKFPRRQRQFIAGARLRGGMAAHGAAAAASHAVNRVRQSRGAGWLGTLYDRSAQDLL
jgi:hypothetical protein